MPFLLHKNDALTEETAASDYQKWLYDDDGGDAEADAGTDGARSSRNELMTITPPNDRSEVYG